MEFVVSVVAVDENGVVSVKKEKVRTKTDEVEFSVS